MTQYENNRPGRATPNPKYKPGIEAKARSTSSNSNTSPETSTVEIKKENIISSEIEGINQVAIKGSTSNNLTYKIEGKEVTQKEYDEQRQKELEPQKIEVAVDYEAVNQYNRIMAEQGIKNAKEYFEAERNPEKKETIIINNQIPPSNTYPKRRINPEETTPYNPEINFKEPFPKTKTSGTINAINPKQKDSMKKPLAKEILFQIESKQIKIQELGEKDPTYKLLTIPERYAYGIFLGAKEFGEGIAGITREQIKNPNPIMIGERFAEGIGAQAGTIITDIKTGNVPGLFEEAGKIQAQTKIAKGLKTGLKEYGSAISEAERSIWLQEKTGANTNPLFKPDPFSEIGIKNINPETKINFLNEKDPLSKYYLIPTEYTETGKTFQKGNNILDPKAANEITPGNIIKETQPSDFQSKKYYKEPGNKPPELQTRLSIEEAPPNNIIRSPQDILELNKQSTQKKLGTTTEKISFFDKTENKIKWEIEEQIKKDQAEAEYKARLIEENKQRNKNLILSTQPIAAAGLILIEEVPKNWNIIKERYGLYKQKIITEPGEIIIRTAPGTKIKTPEFLPIANTRINNPTNQGIYQGSTNLIKLDLTSKPKILNKSAISIRQINQQSTEQSQRINQAQIIKQSTAQSQTQSQATAQSQITTTQQKQIFKQITTPTPPTPEPIKTPLPFPKTKKTNKEKETDLITIKIRKKGIFTNTGTETNIYKAINKAENIIQKTAAASYKLERKGKTITDIKPGRIFFPSKKETGVFIQKKETRIKSPGEKAEITFKGIFTNRNKRRLTKWAF